MNNEIPELPKMSNENENVQDNINEVKEDTVKESYNFKQFFKDAYNYITTRNSSELFELLWRLVLIAVFVIVLYVPFQLVRDLGVELAINIGINFTDKSLNTYNSIWNILYTVVGVVLFFNLCKDRYYKLIKSQETRKKLEEEVKKQ